MRNDYLLYSLDKKIPSEKLYYLNEKIKEVPEEKTAELLAFSSMKDPVTALLLGVFLGGVGAHCFYLNEKKKGIAFAVSFAASFVLMMIGLVVEIAGGIAAMATESDIYPAVNPTFYAGVAIIVISAIFICIVSIAGLIDGLLSYKRAQETNLKSLLIAIDNIKE